jgi:hypothetical protein
MRILRKLKPGHEWVEDFTDGAIRDLSEVQNERAAELLKTMRRPGWTSLEDSLKLNLVNLDI